MYHLINQEHSINDTCVLLFYPFLLSAVAEWLMAPDTQFLLDFVRPDFLMLRVRL